MESTLSTAPQPSYVTLPPCDPPYPSVVEFLQRRFPKIGRKVWQARLDAGKITDDSGRTITPDTPYRPHLRLRYYREVEREPDIPFTERRLFQSEHLLVACKPHFLPVTPAGPYVNHCLLYRLQAATGIEELAPLHRIDRETAGIVLFSVNKATRGIYHKLFSAGKVTKLYEAVAVLPPKLNRQNWLIKNRIVRGNPWFRVTQEPGPVNAITRIRLIERTAQHGYFRLLPLTGKQHQLRFHLTLLGCQILNDRYYPVLQPKRPDDFSHPLQLLAKVVQFRDPLTHQPMTFRSTRTLCWRS
ncbi:pseudouridine synthase [candidate division KSB3 bacterium]|uniref:Pseudouridine synthase n=1 Tax=candidate division KSB3 bacterium TaxID=2044937 RepID=A0A9D5Q568_9BACT|nr:pseudouridine synthase [candidate division KSB3 bacterium]MBD3323611.1 pseudouridine synthase [candidate division KSB3 bacterium]